MAVTLVGSVGTGHNELTTSATSIAATRNGIVAGNLIVVAVTVGNGATITNVSDGTTTNSTPDKTFNSSLVAQQIAANFSPTQAFRSIVIIGALQLPEPPGRELYIHELQGADPVSPLEGTASAQGTSAAPSTGNISPSPTLDGEYIVGYVLSATTSTPSGGFANLFTDAVNTADTAGLAQAAQAAVAATWTMTSGVWGAVAASYKPAPAAGVSVAWVRA